MPRYFRNRRPLLRSMLGYGGPGVGASPCWYQACPMQGVALVWCICCPGGACVPIPFTTPGVQSGRRIPANIDAVMLAEVNSGRPLSARTLQRILIDLNRQVALDWYGFAAYPTAYPVWWPSTTGEVLAPFSQGGSVVVASGGARVGNPPLPAPQFRLPSRYGPADLGLTIGQVPPVAKGPCYVISFDDGRKYRCCGKTCQDITTIDPFSAPPLGLASNPPLPAPQFRMPQRYSPADLGLTLVPHVQPQKGCYVISFDDGRKYRCCGKTCQDITTIDPFSAPPLGYAASY